MCETELPASRLSKVIADRQTDRHDQNYTPRHFAGGQLYERCRYVLTYGERQQEYATFASYSGFYAPACVKIFSARRQVPAAAGALVWLSSSYGRHTEAWCERLTRCKSDRQGGKYAGACTIAYVTERQTSFNSITPSATVDRPARSLSASS